MTADAAYPGFEYYANELTKYTEAAGVFSMLLWNGKIVHFMPANSLAFREWLCTHGVFNIRDW